MIFLVTIPIHKGCGESSETLVISSGTKSKSSGTREKISDKLKQSASEINADLLKYYAEMQNVFKEFEVQKTMPTTQQLKDAFNLRKKDFHL